ncbi:protein FAM136A isoform X1 [Pelodiscus sinensis]|uniref:protein FAM136A isoform X1 n=1 Tax=Pelodiscus sinensis TaxID=13735 RepID=UPI003F6B792C
MRPAGSRGCCGRRAALGRADPGSGWGRRVSSTHAGAAGRAQGAGRSMAEAQQSRMQAAIDSMVHGLERENIRKMQATALEESGLWLPAAHSQPALFPALQGHMFRCSADCCENDKASMQQVHHCIERCHAPLAQAQAVVTKELERFQDRLARCTMHCNDKAKDSLDSGSKEQQVKQQLESCVTKCVDDHMHLIPSMTKKMKETLAAITQ